MFICELCKKNGIIYERENLVPHIKKGHPEINGDTKEYMKMFPNSKLRLPPKTSFSNKLHLSSAIKKSVNSRVGKRLSEEHKALIGIGNKYSEKHKRSREILVNKYKTGEFVHKNKINISKEIIKDLYVEKKMSIYEISKQIKISRRIIAKHIQMYRIPMRDLSESIRLTYNPTKQIDTPLSTNEIDIICGELLGDGSLATDLRKCNKSLPHYRQSSKHNEYLAWLQQKLPSLKWSYQDVGGVRQYFHKKCGKFYYDISSKSHPDLQQIFDKFYIFDKQSNKKTKIIPNDLHLNSTVLRHWFLGDGTLCKSKKNGCWSVTFCTFGFSEESLLSVIIPQLNRLGIICRLKKTKKGPTLWIGQNYLERFYEVIGGISPIYCYNYKFNVVVEKYPHLINNSSILALHKRGETKSVDEAFSHYREHGFPYHKLNLEDRLKDFSSIKEYSSNDILKDDIFLNKVKGTRVATHYHPHIYNIKNINSHFSAMDVFNDDIKFKNILQKIYDKHNGFSDSFVRNGLIIGGAYTPGNFRPLIAKYIYEKYSPDNGIVLDPCAGFGGRLLGCMASSTGHRTYIGVEPEKRNCEGLIKMKNDLNPNFNVSLFSEPFEDFDYHDEYFDLVFTSPPYYNQELYNPNNKFQSHVKYQNYDDWKVYFLWNFISQSYRSLKTNGIFAVAINDIKGHNLLDDFLTYCSMYFDLLKTYKIEYKTNPFVNAESGIAVKYEPLYIFRKKQKCNTNQKF